MSSTPPQTYAVFISYASPNRRLAEELCHKLKEAKIGPVWFDIEEIVCWSDWHMKIEAGCEHSRVVMAVLTPEWRLSEWTKYETYGAEQVLPVFFMAEGESAKDGDKLMPPPLSGLQRFNLDQRDPKCWTLLIRQLRDLLDKPPVEKAIRIVKLAVRPTPDFTGREDYLVRLHEGLNPGPHTNLTSSPVFALVGPAGCGKSSLARHYAEKFWRCYPQILWVDCRKDIPTQFALFADAVVPEAVGKGVGDGELARKVHEVLSQPGAGRQRLLILDGAADKTSVADWIPTSGSCHAMVTSPYREWSPVAENFPIGPLDAKEARDLFLKRSGRCPVGDESDACDRLLAAMGYLPANIEKAASVLRSRARGFGFADYHRLLDDDCNRGEPDDLERTCCISLERVSPAARVLLSLGSMMASTSIPIAFFICGACVIGKRLQAASLTHEVHEKHIRHWIDELHGFSLVTWTDAHSFEIDGTARRLMAGRMARDERPAWRAAAQQLLAASAGQAQALAIDRLAWITHAEAVWAAVYADNPEYAVPEFLTPLVAVLSAWEHLLDAEAPARLDHKLRLERDGPNVETTLGSTQALAAVLRGLAIYDEAEKLLRGCLDSIHQLHGEDHPLSLAIADQLGGLLAEIGRMDEAILFREHAHAVAERTMAAHDSRSIVLALNLADSLAKNYRLNEAAQLYTKILSRLKNLGDRESESMNCLNGMAWVCHALGRYEQARRLFDRAIEIAGVTLGPDHRITLTYRNNRARLLLSVDDYTLDAEADCDPVLDMRQRLFVDTHPEVLGSLAVCGLLREKLGHVEEACDFYRQAWEGFRACYSDGHPDTLCCLGDLARAEEACGQMDVAEELLLAGRETARASGGDASPDFLRFTHDLAVHYFFRGKPFHPLALRLFEAAGTGRRANFGSEHPDTQASIEEAQSLRGRGIQPGDDPRGVSSSMDYHLPAP